MTDQNNEGWPAVLRLNDHYMEEIVGWMQADDKVSGGMTYTRADRAAPEGQVPEQCPVCSGKSFAKIDGEQARWRCVECKTVTPPPAAPTQPTETTNVQKLHEMDMGDGRILTSEMPIPEPIRAPDAEQMEAYDPTTQPYDEPFRHVDHPAAPTDNTALVERHANKQRNVIINRCSTDLETIINGHDPEIGNLNNDVWDRLDKMAVEIEAALASREAPPACQKEAVTESDLAAARAEIERLTKERDLSKELLRSCIQGNNVLRKKAQKAIAERDEARSMLADAERDMRQRAADSCLGLMTAQSARKFILALPLKHADREGGADD